MPRREVMTMELRKIERVGLFADGPKISGRPEWKRWPFRPSMLYNTVAGTLRGYRMMCEAEYDKKDLEDVWVGVEDAEMISGVPRDVLRTRWWAATEGHSYAWPWCSVSCENDTPYIRLKSLIFWSQWVWKKHIIEYYNVTGATVDSWIDEGPIQEGQNPFRVRAGTRHSVCYFPDVVEMAMRGKLWKLMRSPAVLEDMDALMHLSPRAIADLKLGGRWLQTVGGWRRRDP